VVATAALAAFQVLDPEPPDVQEVLPGWDRQVPEFAARVCVGDMLVQVLFVIQVFVVHVQRTTARLGF
jgi:hypothetical protein